MGEQLPGRVARAGNADAGTPRVALARLLEGSLLGRIRECNVFVCVLNETYERETLEHGLTLQQVNSLLQVLVISRSSYVTLRATSPSSENSTDGWPPKRVFSRGLTKKIFCQGRTGLGRSPRRCEHPM